MAAPYKGRREDFRLLTGAGHYTSDWNRPNQLYGHFLRSDRAHAEIASLDVKAALAAPGVVAVLTSADTVKAGCKSAQPLAKYPGKGGMKIKEPMRHPLANGKVRFVGEEVAFVVAGSVTAAQDAAELIEIDYRDLPVVVDAEAALQPGAPLLHDDAPGNLCFEYEYGDAAKTAEAFAGAAHVTKLTLDAARIFGSPMEPKACLAAYEAATDRYDVYTCTQGLSLILHSLADVVNHPADKIRVYAHDVGGGFGVRSEGYPEYAVAMLAARLTGRPVKWVSTRSETLLSDHHGRAAKLIGELALDRDGRFRGIRFEWIVNVGAYPSQPGPLINTLAPSVHAVNAYQIPAAYGLHRLAFTNTTATTAYRGAGRPNVTYIIERLVDEASHQLNIDRAELRRRNLIPKSAFPYKTPPGAVYDSGDPPGELEKVLQHAQWSGFEQRRAEAKARGKLRGLGLAVFVEPSGGGSLPNEEIAIKFGASGNPIVYAMAGPSGQGHETTFPQIVDEVLGLGEDNIVFRPSDPDGPKIKGEGTIGSRSVMSHGSAMVVAAREIIKKGTELAARHLEAAVEDIRYDHGRFSIAGTDRSVRLAELAAHNAGALDTVGANPPPRAFPGGAHVAEVEIDPETGAIEIVRYTGVDDCGRIINHKLVDGQLHGGIAQGIGQVIGEVGIYDTTGQLLTGSFMDYYMPRADALPSFTLYDHPVPAPGNPLGAKGAGESGTTGSVPTLANAVIDALRPLGIDRLEFPYTPDRVWRAIDAANGSQAGRR